MSYYGKAFVFDGVPCETYDLMMYDVGNQDEDIKLSSVSAIEDEVIAGKWRPYFYGTKPGEKLEFDITFGVNTRRIDNGKYLDRWELADVATWLTGHQEYKWLYIDSPDSRMYGYRCIITDLKVTVYGSVPWAMTAHVTCDSPYAYLESKDITYNISGTRTINIYNESSLNGFYYPQVSFIRSSGSSFSVRNVSDNNKGPVITNIPGSVGLINIDNEHLVVSNDQDLNLYEGFNFQFLRLLRGRNTLTVTGNGRFTMTCEYPINVGG